jgi:hypothetical protein
VSVAPSPRGTAAVTGDRATRRLLRRCAEDALDFGRIEQPSVGLVIALPHVDGGDAALLDQAVQAPARNVEAFADLFSCHELSLLHGSNHNIKRGIASRAIAIFMPLAYNAMSK